MRESDKLLCELFALVIRKVYVHVISLVGKSELHLRFGIRTNVSIVATLQFFIPYSIVHVLLQYYFTVVMNFRPINVLRKLYPFLKDFPSLNSCGSNSLYTVPSES